MKVEVLKREKEYINGNAVITSTTREELSLQELYQRRQGVQQQMQGYQNQIAFFNTKIDELSEAESSINECIEQLESEGSNGE